MRCLDLSGSERDKPSFSGATGPFRFFFFPVSPRPERIVKFMPESCLEREAADPE